VRRSTSWTYGPHGTDSRQPLLKLHVPELNGESEIPGIGSTGWAIGWADLAAVFRVAGKDLSFRAGTRFPVTEATGPSVVDTQAGFGCLRGGWRGERGQSRNVIAERRVTFSSRFNLRGHRASRRNFLRFRFRASACLTRRF